MGLTVQNVYGLLLRSRLLAVNDAKAIYERWQREAKNQAGDLERFRRWLVGHHYLTDYQAKLLCQGHAEGFFLNDYKILDRVGRGRMAGVYKAVHSLGQVVAIKVLPPSKAKDSYLFSRFQREAKLALQLKHPNVVRTFQVGEAGGLHYLVMEFLDGETLEEVVYRRKKLPPAEAVRIIYQALVGLQHIHEKGMVHRDLKPSNLMLVSSRLAGQADTTMNATVKILDIGLARMFFDENVPASALMDEDGVNHQLTGDGVLLGTPDYLAPEQARNARAVDIRADIYSMGCVLYACLTGNPPFPDTNILNQILRHAAETARPLKEFNPEVPDGLQQIVNWMMAKDPAERYPTPERAAQALQVFLVAGGEARPPEADASMTQYLSWLEGHVNAPGPGAAPIANPPVDASGSRPSRSSGKGSRSGRSNRHSKHGSRKKKKKSRGTGGAESPEFDVELVAQDIPQAVPILPPGGRPRFSRRDLLILGLGAMGMVGAVLVGGALATGGFGRLWRKLTGQPPEEPEGK